MPFETINQAPTLIAQAYSAILAAICEGRLVPGERLNQDDIAAKLRISRQPVGQALSILKAQGFVRDTGRRGMIVAPIEREYFLAIYELREAIDPMAVRLAAERAVPVDLVEGRKLLAEGRRALDSGSIEALIAADMQFHMWIYRVAGNPLLVETMGLYWNHLRRAMAEVLRHAPQRGRVWDEHEGMLDAIAHRDAVAAERWALQHARDAALRVAESIPATPATVRVAAPEPRAARSGRQR